MKIVWITPRALIASKNSRKKKSEKRGIENFFARHGCNLFCKGHCEARSAMLHPCTRHLRTGSNFRSNFRWQLGISALSKREVSTTPSALHGPCGPHVTHGPVENSVKNRRDCIESQNPRTDTVREEARNESAAKPRHGSIASHWFAHHTCNKYCRHWRIPESYRR